MASEKKANLATIGGNVAPGLVGGAISAMFVAHSGAPLIPALGAAIVRAGMDLWAAHRVEDATASLREGIALRLKAGHTPRAELLNPDSGRGVVDELFEGAVRAAHDDFEARKAMHFGRFVVNFVFTPSVSAADARTLLRIAQRLNWRQWMILEWIRRGVSPPIEQDVKPSRTAAVARQDFQDLVAGELVDLNKGEAGEKTLALTELGDSIAALLGLSDLDLSEIQELVADVSEGIRANPPSVYVTSG